MERSLYLIAYDICKPKRLTRTRKVLKGYSSGGQKSVFECFLTQGELSEIQENLVRTIHPDEDRLHIFFLDGRSRVHTLGIAVPPRDPDFFYYG